MLYSGARIVEILASVSNDFGIVFICGAWLFSILCLGFIGRTVRSALEISDLSFTPWAFDISLGLVINATYLFARSFITRIFTFIPPVLEMELVILLVLLKLFPHTRKFISLSPKNPLYFLFIVIAIFINCFGFSVSILPASSDPAILSGLTDVIRNAGYIQNYFSNINLNLPNYPLGIQILTWGIANPLLPTNSIVGGFPGLATALTGFMIFEFVVGRLRLSYRHFLQIALSFLVWKLFIFTFELSNFWSFLEGRSKTCVHFLAVLSLVLSAYLRKSSSRNTSWQNIFYLTTAIISSAFMIFVNPINAYIAGGVFVFIFLYNCLQKNFPIKISLISIGISALLALIFFVQDPVLITSVKGKLLSCFLFGEQIPYCSWDQLIIQNATRAAVTVLPHDPIKGFALANYFQDPIWAFLPKDLKPFLSESAQKIYYWLCGLFIILLVLNWKKLIYKKFFLMTLLISVAVLLLLSALQSFALSQYGPVRFRFLVQPYMSLSYLNIWIPAVFSILSCTIYFLFSYFQKSKNHLLARYPGLIVMSILTVTFALWYHPLTEATGKYQRKIAPATSRKSQRSYASLIHANNERIEKNTLSIINSFPVQMGLEQWIFTSTREFTLQLYGKGLTLFSYSLFWPPINSTVKQHFTKLCGADACKLLNQYKIDRVTVFEDMFCGKKISDWAETNSCIDKSKVFEKKDKDLRIITYEVLKDTDEAK